MLESKGESNRYYWLHQIFETSLVKAGTTVSGLVAAFNSNAKKDNQVIRISYRSILYLKNRLSKLGDDALLKDSMKRNIRKLARMPFFWNDKTFSYFTEEQIINVIENGCQASKSSAPFVNQISDQEEFDFLIKKIINLPPQRKISLMQIILTSMETINTPENNINGRISLTTIGYLRLPVILHQSLLQRGFGDDFLKAARSTCLENDHAEFAAFLKEIVRRNLIAHKISFKPVALEAIAELCCEVKQWNDDLTNLTVVINPRRTYKGRVHDFLSTLNLETGISLSKQ